MKTKYIIPCSWQMYGYVNVEASDWDDAVEEAYGDEVPLPKDGEYVISSFEVDHDGIEYEEEEEANHQIILVQNYHLTNNHNLTPILILRNLTILRVPQIKIKKMLLLPTLHHVTNNQPPQQHLQPHQYQLLY